MKKILKPSKLEEAVYYSDFSGELFKDFVPATIKIECDYGSDYDGARIELHLSDKEIEKLLEFLKHNLTPETKEDIKNQVDSNCLSRDNFYNKELFKKLI
jgi:hypothetical protein